MIQLFIPLLYFIHTAHGLSLQQAFEASLKNEDVQSAQLNIEKNKIQKKLAISAVLPTLEIRGVYTKQQEAAVFSRGFGQSNQRTLQLSLSQPIFQGFKEFRALELTNINIETSKHQFESSRLEIYLLVIQSYFNIIFLEKESLHLEKLKELYSERVQFLRKRVKIGRSRKSELYSAQSSLANVEVERENLKTALSNEKANLKYLTKLDAYPTASERNEDIKLSQLPYYLGKIEEHPKIQALNKQVQASEKSISITKSDYWPNLSLGSNYYFERGGALSEVKWDVSVNLSYPIFEGGKTNYELQTAVTQKTQSTLELHKIKNELSKNISLLYQDIENGLKRNLLQKKSAEINELKLKELKSEYQLSLVTNLEVLQALNDFIQSKRDLNKIKYENIINYYSLKTLTGEWD